jgi:hypothetical protein
MTQSLRALLAGSIDYAGLFPPASLPLDQAISNYGRYRGEPESWLLSRFVCPAARLAELGPRDALFQSDPPFAFTALGCGGHDVLQFGSGIRADVEAIAAFQERHGERVRVETFEVRLPEDLTRPHPAVGVTLPEKIGDFIRGVSDLVAQHTLSVFCESTPTSDWRALLTAVIAGITKSRADALPGRFGQPLGFKLRCGGADAAAFPPAEQLALAITACRDAGVPIKFTAGLHHPIRRFDPGFQTHVHGFLNVLAAGVLAHARRLNEDEVRQILEDEDPTSFVFDEHGLRWKALRATTDETARARREAVTSFGSCSFDEPRDDLINLGLL